MSLYTLQLMQEAHQRKEESARRYAVARKQARDRTLSTQELALAADSLYEGCLGVIQSQLAAECMKDYGRLELQKGRLKFQHNLPGTVDETVPSVVVAGVQAKFEASGWSVEHSYDDDTGYDWLTLLSPTDWPLLLAQPAGTQLTCIQKTACTQELAKAAEPVGSVANAKPAAKAEKPAGAKKATGEKKPIKATKPTKKTK